MLSVYDEQNQQDLEVVHLHNDVYMYIQSFNNTLLFHIRHLDIQEIDGVYVLKKYLGGVSYNSHILKNVYDFMMNESYEDVREEGRDLVLYIDGRKGIQKCITFKRSEKRSQLVAMLFNRMMRSNKIQSSTNGELNCVLLYQSHWNAFVTYADTYFQLVDNIKQQNVTQTFQDLEQHYLGKKRSAAKPTTERTSKVKKTKSNNDIKDEDLKPDVIDQVLGTQDTKRPPSRFHPYQKKQQQQVENNNDDEFADFDIQFPPQSWMEKTLKTDSLKH